MQPYIGLFTIGPVQSFISQARKLQDLHAGSQMLSHFANEAAEWLRKHGVEVIFPAKDLESAPNRILFTYPAEEATAVADLCKECEVYLREEFLLFCGEQLQKPQCNLKMTEPVKSQLEPFLKFFWAAASLGDDYGEAYRLLLLRLGAAKTVRAFEQNTEPSARKCSITGQQNALFAPKKWKPPWIREQKNLSEHCQFLDSGNQFLKDNEALSAIAFIKRCYGVPENEDPENKATAFPSTRLIAKGKLFPESKDLSQDEQDEKSKKEEDTDRYYAILCFDGDKMGEKYGECKSAEAQAFLSKKLGEFARWARDYVESDPPKGRLIYAGGEDFLGVFPLNTVYAALRGLREKFLETFQAEKITFSAGLVFAHCKTPLRIALEQCRAMEHMAKENGRNALAIAALKHSGSIETAWFRFNDNLLSATEHLYKAMRVEKICSANFVYALMEEFQPLLTETRPCENFYDMFVAEAKRLLRRSLSESFSEEKRAKAGEELSENLQTICNEMEQMQAVRLLRIFAFVARNGGDWKEEERKDD
ncbi:MAG: type III-B CRISPR-associated protein Cas10/Cmr2 [Oscillospiraceae bacterium]|nr:type III-B CRISPR-associated protein Cas10/Cmr2 [Oscillospiraceae bacterium]